MDTKKNIWFIILTYKSNLDLVKKNFSFLKKYSSIIVDNSLNEDIRKEIENIKSLSKYIKNSENTGYSGGMNIGLKYAFEQGAEWVVLLNDDLVLSEEGVEALVKALEHQAPGVLGPYVGSLDPKRWTTILSDDQKNIDYISGSFFVVHKDVNAKVQGFYPDFFMYYEDVDYCVQAKRLGFPLVKLNIPGIVHKDGTSIEKGSALHEYYLARNHLLFVERQAPWSVKIREFIRLPKTLWDHYYFQNKGALSGVLDFLFLRYGKKKGTN